MFLFMFIQPQHSARLYSAEKLIALSTPPSACFDLQIFKRERGGVRLEQKSPFQHLFNVTFWKYIWHPLVYRHLQFVKAPRPQFHQCTDRWLWIITVRSFGRSATLLCLMGKSIRKCWKQKSMDWQVARAAEPLTTGPLWATVTAERWSGMFQLKLSWDFCVKQSLATVTRQGCPIKPWIFTPLRDRTADGPKKTEPFLWAAMCESAGLLHRSHLKAFIQHSKSQPVTSIQDFYGFLALSALHTDFCSLAFYSKADQKIHKSNKYERLCQGRAII